MPAGSPAASQLDTRRPEGELTAKRLRHAVAARSAFGGFAVVFVLALCSRPLLAAPATTAIPVSGLQEEWLRPILCGAAGMIAFLILWTAVRFAREAFAGRSNRAKNADSPITSVEHFVQDAQKLHIDPEIARETFQLLASLIPPETSFNVNDELRGVLRLSERQIDSLLSALPEVCDRSRIPVSAASVLSVYDLLQHIQSSPKSTSGQFYLRTGSTVPPLSTLASPLADLKNASPRDSRFRTRAHFSGVKRRASDYSGPYRRATDRRPEENYTGPLRRASDRQDTGSTGLDPRHDPRVGDRRSSERRAAVSQENSEPAKQHRAVSADTSLLNQCINVPPAQVRSETERELSPASMKHESRVQTVASLQRG